MCTCDLLLAEVTIKQLREKVKESEEKLEQSAQASLQCTCCAFKSSALHSTMFLCFDLLHLQLRAKEKEKELQRNFAEKERQLQETQLSVVKKLGEAEHRVLTLQSGTCMLTMLVIAVFEICFVFLRRSGDAAVGVFRVAEQVRGGDCCQVSVQCSALREL